MNPDGTVLALRQRAQARERARDHVADNPYVALASTPSGKGYWVVDAHGDVDAFGDAHDYGGADDLHLNQPVLGMAPTASGKGYWLLARDGGIFSYGDAAFYGSTGAMRLNAPIIVDGVDARWARLLAARERRRRVQLRQRALLGLDRLDEAERAGHLDDRDAAAGGYLLLASDGGLFSFGNSHFLGSLPGTGWCPGPTALAFVKTPKAAGYWMLLSDGRIVSFGQAQPWGEPATTHVRPVAIAAAQ